METDWIPEGTVLALEAALDYLLLNFLLRGTNTNLCIKIFYDTHKIVPA